ncbi:hypothetical protein Naga_100952g2, partial [Nannochloropsis gaditana]
MARWKASSGYAKALRRSRSEHGRLLFLSVLVAAYSRHIFVTPFRCTYPSRLPSVRGQAPPCSGRLHATATTHMRRSSSPPPSPSSSSSSTVPRPSAPSPPSRRRTPSVSITFSVPPSPPLLDPGSRLQPPPLSAPRCIPAPPRPSPSRGPPVPATSTTRRVLNLLTDALPDLDPSLLPLLPSSFFQQPPERIQARLSFLHTTLPGIDLPHALRRVPKLLTYYGMGAPAMERRLAHTYSNLIAALPKKQAALNLLNAAPRLLLRDFETRIEPYLHTFTTTSPTLDAAYLLTQHPVLLHKGIASHLLPRLAALPTLFPPSFPPPGPEDLGALLTRYPPLLTLPLPDLSARLAALSLLLPPDLLLPTLIRHPRAWTADLTEVIGPQIHLLLSALGPTTTKTVLHHLPSILYHPPDALTHKLDLLSSLLGSSAGANVLLARNPMILAMDIAANVAPKLRYLHSLFPHMDETSFVSLVGSAAGSQCLSAAFGRLGRLSYLLQIQPDMDVEEGMRLVGAPSEELRRWYPGYENFLEDRIEPRFPAYSWEQLCALPFAVREQAHGELLHGAFSREEGGRRG